MVSQPVNLHYKVIIKHSKSNLEPHIKESWTSKQGLQKDAIISNIVQEKETLLHDISLKFCRICYASLNLQIP